MATTDRNCVVAKLQTSLEISQGKNNIGELNRWHRCNWNNVNQKNICSLIHLSLSSIRVTSSFRSYLFYKSLDDVQADSMTKLRKQPICNRLQNQFTAGKKITMSVWWKTVTEGLKMRPRAAFSSPRPQLFTRRTSQPANDIYVCWAVAALLFQKFLSRTASKWKNWRENDEFFYF